MKKINLLFEFNIPVSLREYRFFEIGKDHKYIDDYSLELRTIQVANKSIKPFISLIENTFYHINSPATVTLSINGSTLSLLQLYTPEIIEDLKKLQEKGYIELCSTLFTNSILANKPIEFIRLIEANQKVLNTLSGKRSNNFNLTNQPITFNTFNELIQFQPCNIYLSEEQAYTIKNSSASLVIVDEILSKQFGVLLSKNSDGFADSSKVVNYLDELELRSTNRNNTLIHWKPDLNNFSIGISQQVIFQELIEGLIERNYLLNTGEQQIYNGAAYPFDIVYHKKELHDFTPEFNEMQMEVIDLMCTISERISQTNSPVLLKNWLILQDDINVKYISSEFLSNSYSKLHYSPYNGPYEAFMNIMNILNDFELVLKNEIVQKVF